MNGILDKFISITAKFVSNGSINLCHCLALKSNDYCVSVVYQQTSEIVL